MDLPTLSKLFFNLLRYKFVSYLLDGTVLEFFDCAVHIFAAVQKTNFLDNIFKKKNGSSTNLKY